MPDKTILFVAQAHTVTALFPRFKDAGVQAGIADSLSGALSFVRKSRPCLVFTQAKIGGAYQAQALLAAAREEDDFPPVIVFTDRGTAQEAQALMELGARDYWLEPLNWDKIQAVLPAGEDGTDQTRDQTSAAQGAATGAQVHAQSRPHAEGAPAPSAAARPASVQAGGGQNGAAQGGSAPGVTGERFAIIGSHPAVLRVLTLARQVAKSKATVLISGESGTGKEMFARFLHAHSDRAAKPFVALNCAALPEHLLESELFGHERGAFTGAIARKMGKFELAAGGTILLDEISEMDLGLQAKLLRVLQEGEFDRVGGTETIRVDVRVLATTNRRLEQYVEENKFRQDLYYRLNVIPLKLPPLRERGEDVLSLAVFFVDKYCRTYCIPRPAFSPAARDWLLSYAWPGNVRELQNLMERAVLLAGGGVIEKAHFLLEGEEFPLVQAALPGAPAAGEPAVVMERVTSVLEPPRDAAPGGGRPMPEGIVPLDVLEREMILKSLDQTSGNRTQAAQLLGISVRTLRNKLSEYRQLGLEIP